MEVSKLRRQRQQQVPPPPPPPPRRRRGGFTAAAAAAAVGAGAATTRGSSSELTTKTAASPFHNNPNHHHATTTLEDDNNNNISSPMSVVSRNSVISTLTIPSDVIRASDHMTRASLVSSTMNGEVDDEEEEDDEEETDESTSRRHSLQDSLSITTGSIDDPHHQPHHHPHHHSGHHDIGFYKKQRRSTFTKHIPDFNSLDGGTRNGAAGAGGTVSGSGGGTTTIINNSITYGGKDQRIIATSASSSLLPEFASSGSLPPHDNVGMGGTGGGAGGGEHPHPPDSSNSILLRKNQNKRWSGNTIYAPSRKGRSQSSLANQIQINKPRFDRLKLRGRDDEKDILRKCTEKIRGSVGSVVVVDATGGGMRSGSSSVTSTTGTGTGGGGGGSVGATAAAAAAGAGAGITPPPPFSSNLTTITSDSDRTPTSSHTSQTNSIAGAKTTIMDRPAAAIHQLVLISGVSGCGKTALASNVKRNIERKTKKNKQKPGLYLIGKFDQTTTSSGNPRPYDAFVQVFQRLVGRILEEACNDVVMVGGGNDYDVVNDGSHPNHSKNKSVVKEEEEYDDRFERFQQDFTTSLSVQDDLVPLTQTFPELQELLPQDVEAKIMKVTTRMSKVVGEGDDGGAGGGSGTGSGAAVDTSENGTRRPSTGSSTANQANRLHQACKKVLQILRNYFCPLVITLDDLQWADGPSLELLQVLLSDDGMDVTSTTKTSSSHNIINPKNKLMIIGIYRSDEIHNAPNAAHAVQSLRNKASGIQQRPAADDTDTPVMVPSFEITEMELGNLTRSDVEEVLSDLFSMDGTVAIRELAEVCIEKTGGNVFFLLTFVKMLFAMDFLEFNFASMDWNWNAEQIRLETATTDNVADTVKARILNSLDGDSLLAIKLASCLGAHFPERMLEVVYYNFQDDNDVGNDGSDGAASIDKLFPEVLQALLNESILVKSTGSTYIRWTHDRLQETAFSLIPDEEVSPMRKKMGQILMRSLDREEIATSIFILVDLFNAGSSPELAPDRIELAELNLRGAQRALAMSAMEATKYYSSKGMDLLPSDKWTSHNALTLGLYKAACKAAIFLGEHDRVDALSQEVFEQDGQLTLQQQLPIYFEKLLSLEAQDGMYQPAIDIYLKILKQMGYKFPKSKGALTWQITKSIFKLKSAPKKLTQEVFVSIPLMGDEGMISAMIVLDKLAAISVMATNPVFLLVADRSFEMTIKNGLCQTSPAVFALVAMILVMVLGDFENGGKIGNYALQALTMVPNAERIEPRVRYLCHFFVLTWTEPFNSMVKPLLRGYEIGLRVGDVDGAAYCIIMYIILALLCGRPLEGLSDDCEIYYRQLHDLGRDRVIVFSRVWWQTILNLRGDGGTDCFTLEGKAMDMTEDEYIAFASLPENIKNVLPTVRILKGFLYTFLGEYQLGADLAVQHGRSIFNDYPTNPANMGASYYFGVCLVDAAIKTKRRKYKVHAKQMFARLHGYVKRRNPNVAHYHLGLEAELLVLSGRYNEATMKFQAAIALASRSGFIHDAALMSERFAIFLFASVPNEEEEAVFHLKAASKLYREWGALKKVERLNESYASVLLEPVSKVIKVTESQEIAITKGIDSGRRSNAIRYSDTR